LRNILLTVFLLLAWGVEAGATDLARQRSWFAKAEQALAKGDRSKFHAWLAKLGDYPLVPYLYYRYYLKYPGEEESIGRFLRQYADTRYARPVRAGLLRHLAKKGRWREYVWYYQDLENKTLQCHYAWALYRLGRIGQAWRETRRLWLVGHSQPKACDRVFRAWKQAGNLTPDLVWRRFELALGQGKTRLAEYLARQLPPAERDRAFFWLKVHTDPEKHLCALWPKPFSGDGKIFGDGIMQLARKDLEAAIEVWERERSNFHLTLEQVSRVDRFIGLRLAWRHDRRAWEWLAAIPAADRDRDVNGWQVRAALREGNWGRVLHALESLSPGERHETRWRYWHARALERLHGKASARQTFAEVAKQMDFYGFLAADKLRADYAIVHRPLKVSEKTVENLAQTPTFRAIGEFIHLDRYWDARREWWYLLKHGDRETLRAAAILARRSGWPQMAIFAVARAEHWDDLDIRFPLRFLEQVRDFSRARKVDTAYIFGIIRRESAFDQHAHSPVGARGLMQLMPYTARKVARQLQERIRSLKSLEDSATNVRYGTAYFSSLLERFGGHFVLATAAYNAGPHRVDRWMPAKISPADIWIETIPFRETRRYVRAVLAYAMIYHQRLGQKQRRISEYATPVPAVEKAPAKSPLLVCSRSS